MSNRKQAAPPVDVTLFRGDHLEPILRNILQCLDAAEKLAEAGYQDAHRYTRFARNQLHDLLCEVVS